jgi:hypothetical protein
VNELADQLDLAASNITPDLTPDQVAEVYVKGKAYLERGKLVMKAIESAMEQYITETGKPIVIGPVRFYVGEKKETKCVDQGEALRSLLELFGPDHIAAQFLSTGAFKLGAIKKEVDEETYGRLFKVEVKQELKDGVAKAEKKLQSIDERFIR